jgi:glycosyltransferase involved in cell wall biosynthesis
MIRTIRYSIVTTCKSRLEHLKTTLPAFLAFEGAEVIVVDYGCPQGTGDFVKQNYPAAKVVSVTDDQGFNPSRARNAGARQAVGEYLFFMDADVVIRDLKLNESMRTHERPDRFITFSNSLKAIDLLGSCLVPKEAFDKIGGYDEVISVYGGEERDLYARLRFHGVGQFLLNVGGYLETIKHSNEERMSFREGSTVRNSVVISTCYRQLKLGLMRFLGKELDYPERLALWKSVKSQSEEKFLSDANRWDFVIEVPLETPYWPLKGIKYSRKLMLTVEIS